MKKGIHPDNYTDTEVSCSCGNKITVKSSVEKINLELCNKCHPAYTGEKRKGSSRGRVEQFNKKYGLKDEQ